MSLETICDLLDPAGPRTSSVTVVGVAGKTRLDRSALRAGAARWASALAGLSRGDRVAACMPTSPDLVCGILGILGAGGAVVPLPHPMTRSPQKSAAAWGARLALAEACGARAILTSPEQVEAARAACARRGLEVRILCRADLPDAAAWAPAPVAPDDLAVVQYTSGSTGAPKGVEITHANVLWNSRAMHDAVELRAGERVVAWLPLYHDMGLIGTFMGPLDGDVDTVLLATELFLADPSTWLRAIHETRGTMTMGPTFGYALAVRRVSREDAAALDLSSLRVAYCGAEPVDAEVLEAFADRFAASGLRPHAVVPSYGLAEATLGVTFGRAGRPFRSLHLDRRRLEEEGIAVPTEPHLAPTVRIVSVGAPIGGGEIRILDGEGGDLGELRQGEIAVRNGSLTRGYLANPEATAKVLAGGWLRTGDLGFVHDGELFVTGRKKDLIICGGRNYHPHDIEWIVGRVPGIRSGCVVAFGIVDREHATEQVVVVAETREQDPARRRGMEREIRGALSARIECVPGEVLLVPPGVVPKTSSGKLRRNELRDRWERGALRRDTAA